MFSEGKQLLFEPPDIVCVEHKGKRKTENQAR